MFDTSNFMPHGHCYLWRPDVLWTHVISDAVVGLAYFSIPVVILVYISRKKNVEPTMRSVLAMFVAFILLCGSTHFLNIWTVWQPDYVIEGYIKALTALASLGTAVALWPLLRPALSIPTPSELTELNSKLHSLNEDLENRVEKRTKLLQTKRQLLERSNLDLMQFAYVASHDLKAPTRHLISYSEILSEEIGGSISEHGEKALSRIQESATRMSEMVDSLLTLSRVENQDIDKNITNISTPLNSALQTLYHEIENASIEISVNSEMPEVAIDAPMFERLFVNLIENAISYRKPDVPLTIDISSEYKNNECIVSVRDNGIGIAEEYLERIFTIFQRLHRDDNGSGIGLAICRKIVKLHGGRLWVESEPGVGSTFFVAIPSSDNRTRIGS